MQFYSNARFVFAIFEYGVKEPSGRGWQRTRRGRNERP